MELLSSLPAATHLEATLTGKLCDPETSCNQAQQPWCLRTRGSRKRGRRPLLGLAVIMALRLCSRGIATPLGKDHHC